MIRTVPVMSSDKKRKASSALEARPKKKKQPQTASSSGATPVEHIPGHDTLKPIIAITPGTTFPDVRLRAYNKKSTSETPSQLLLHSSDHPTIDYTAVEGTESSEAHLKHYVAVYDPKINTLKLTVGKRLTIRGSIRQEKRPDESDSEDAETANFIGSQGTRAALTEAFGSKKSKKAVASMAENRQIAQGAEGATIAEAITSHLDNASDSDDLDEISGAAANTLDARSNKPLPTPNLMTGNIDEVYSLSTLIHPQPYSSTLQDLPLSGWLARFKIGKEVTGIRSRFVAHRLDAIGKRLHQNPADAKWLQQAQLLRYILLLVDIHTVVSRQNRFSRLPQVSDWPENAITGGADAAMRRIAGAVVHRYFPDNKLQDRCLTLLRTSIFALTLHVLPPSGVTGGQLLVAEPSDVQMDLAMEMGEVKKLYHELGCVVKPPGEKELLGWGYTKLARKSGKKEGDAVRPAFAVLKFPLSFPKVSTGGRRGRR